MVDGTDETTASLNDEIVRLRTLLAERDHEIEKLRALVTQIEQDKLDERAKPVLSDGPVMLTASGPAPPVEAYLPSVPMWLEGFDRLKDVPGKPVGFNCRRCGVRVKGMRHVDPRLLCFDCIAMPADRA